MALKVLRPSCAVRTNIKNFEDDYEKSENDIKALQSVGQIVGEVTRQLDEERCRARSIFQLAPPLMARHRSHRQGILWTALCCRMQVVRQPRKAQARHPSVSRHDHPDRNAVRLNLCSSGTPPLTWLILLDPASYLGKSIRWYTTCPSRIPEMCRLPGLGVFLTRFASYAKSSNYRCKTQNSS